MKTEQISRHCRIEKLGRHVEAMPKLSKWFLIDCVSKNNSFFQKGIWLCKKTNYLLLFPKLFIERSAILTSTLMMGDLAGDPGRIG